MPWTRLTSVTSKSQTLTWLRSNPCSRPDTERNLCIGKVSASLVAEEFLKGLPSTDGVGLKVVLGIFTTVRHVINFAVVVAVALLPSLLRVAQQSSAASLPNVQAWLYYAALEGMWCKVVWIVYMFWGSFGFWGIFILGPGKLRVLFAEMLSATTALHAMLRGPKESNQRFLPAVVPRKGGSFLLWDELRGLHRASVRLRKLSMEIDLAFVLTLLGVMCTLFLTVEYSSDNTQHIFAPIILLAALFVAMLNIVPVLLMGFLINDETHALSATIFRVWHELAAMAAFTQAHSSALGVAAPNEGTGLSETLELVRVAALEIQHDPSLVVKVLGVELSFRGFVAIASSFNVVGSLIWRKVREKGTAYSLFVSCNVFHSKQN
mmetsp:Transcript_16280/g.56800  ORF Transcript_16280/g.56800 Transcript_16280/m.56800 type:complete len:378 (+) Transcript_16280:290-1423(+)